MNFATKAQRKAVPMLISISSVSGGGKTYSALLLAAGLAGPNGRVGFLDTENGRGEMYTDSPGIMKALPNGFLYERLDPPFAPTNYTAAISAAERAGIDVLVIDSITHEWEGIGGCTEIAENNKLRGMPNWAKAKMEHKRFMNHCLSASLHIVFCIRAREKVKIVKDAQGKDQFVPLGLMPVTEKNFVFEQLLSLGLEENTHFACALKAPEALRHLYSTERLVTKQDGEAIRQWNESAPQVDPLEHVKKRARAAAEDGVEAYKAFFASLTQAQQRELHATTHAENKQLAEEADRAAKEAEQPEAEAVA